MPNLSVICDSRAHCKACRADGEAGERFRAGLAKHYAEIPAGWPKCPHGVGPDVPPPVRQYPGSVPLTVRRTYRGFVVQEPPPATAEQVATFALAQATGTRVPEDVMVEREGTCAACPHVRWSRAGGKLWCSRCGCGVGGVGRWFLRKLTELVENLPKWGCHHPERKKGAGWRR